MSSGGPSTPFGRKSGAIAEALKPVVESFPYSYQEVSQFFETYRNAMAEFGAMCNSSMSGGCTNDQLAQARERLSVHRLKVTLRYPDIGRVRGDADVLPDRIEEVQLTPDSLTLYANTKTHFEFVGHVESRRFTIVVYEDDNVFVKILNYPQ